MDEFVTYDSYGHLHIYNIYNPPPLISIVYKTYVSLKPYGKNPV